MSDWLTLLLVAMIGAALGFLACGILASNKITELEESISDALDLLQGCSVKPAIARLQSAIYPEFKRE